MLRMFSRSKIASQNFGLTPKHGAACWAFWIDVIHFVRISHFDKNINLGMTKSNRGTATLRIAPKAEGMTHNPTREDAKSCKSLR